MGRLHHDRERIEACLRGRTDRSHTWPEGGLPELREVKVVDKEVVWRAELSPEVNAVLIAGFLSSWRPAA